MLEERNKRNIWFIKQCCQTGAPKTSKLLCKATAVVGHFVSSSEAEIDFSVLIFCFAVYRYFL